VTALGALGSRLEERLTTHAATVGVTVGVVDKAAVGDIRASPALEIIDRLEAIAWEQADLGAYDLMLLLTAHAEFDPKRLVSDAWLVVDTRYATGALGEFPHVVRL
jgi:UDP-N-acetyl-D-mannosaminuronate dehydrogenase